jgi:hypothetical protein
VLDRMLQLLFLLLQLPFELGDGLEQGLDGA